MLMLSPLFANGQQSTVLRDRDVNLREAFELFDKEKYGPAQRAFNQAAAQYSDPASEVRKTAEYYAALCAVELFHRDAEYLLTRFIHDHPESPLVKQAWFQLGKFFFREKKYKKALEWFKIVEPELLAESDREEFWFKSGYSYFKTDNFDRALAAFAEIKDGSSAYATTATYYYGHIQYSNRNYESALEHFRKLDQDEVFGPVVPFYISQIYYLQKRYDQVIVYAQPVLDSTRSKRGPEIARLIGESYYNTNRYKEALPYLEQYRDKAPGQRTRDDEYQLGFVYYKLNRFSEAVPCFQQAVGDQDALGQNAWYHLGWCQLQSGNKKFARSAWQQAAKSDFDKDIKEQALFNYAKLAYELGYDPYDEAVRALQDYMNEYPESSRLDEAYTFLANIYTTTKNYRTALLSLDRIKQKTPALKAAYQRVAYFRGIELLNDKNYAEAIRHFELSTSHPENKELVGQANYWKAEAYYRSGNYPEAVKGYQAFIYSLNSFNQKNFNRANYNLAYAFYKQKDYTGAITWFRKYLAAYDPLEVKIAHDAYLRVADCYFVTKAYPLAIEYYDKAIALRLTDTDYALYQKALAQGVTGKQQEKIKTLNDLISNFSTGNFVDDAKFETGKSYQNLGRDEEAFATYDGILLNHPKSTYAPAALVQMALIRYNQNRDQDALALYKRAVEDYPGTEQAREAQLGIKRIYVEEGNQEALIPFLQSSGLGTGSSLQLDSTLWEAAENSYLKGSCEKALPQLAGYLREFPEGIFSLTALGYKADCEMKARKTEDAAATYRLIVGRPQNKYTADAHQMLGIYEREKENFQEALNHFKALELNARSNEQTILARTNIMRISSRMQNDADASSYAQKLLGNDKTPEDVKQEARITIARAQMVNGNYDQAMEHFQKLRKLNSAIGAESRYNIAEIHHRKGDYNKAEKAIFDLVDEMPGYDYWLAKAFILLADNYVKLGNTFQAKRTLQSVIDNHEGEELRTIAVRKLNSLEIQEQAPVQQENEEEIQFRNNQKDEQLFDDQEGGGND